ncbi:MAG: restriction endonuclease subunit S [Oscillospiraceae bacterium]|jgi:type I restriction enzyme S subunit
MNQAIKERIEKIKRGEVPEGYKTIGNIGIIPVEWPEGVLSEVLYHEVRAVPKPTNAYWRLGLRSHAKGTFHELVQDPETVDMEELFEVKENDLIVNITFAWEHAVAIASKEDEGKLVSHRFPTYVFNHGSSPQFFKYIVMQRWFRKLLENISPGGAGRNRVMSKPAFLKLPCYIPPLHEQEKIAEILSTWDKAILLMENLIEEKKKQKKWLMQNLLNPDSGVRLPGFEGEWENTCLKDIVSIRKEKVNSQVNTTNYYCIELEHIESNTGRILGYVSSQEQLSTKTKFKRGDILFGKLRPYLRKVAIAPFDGVCSSEIWPFKVNRKISGIYLYYYMQSDKFIAAANIATGTKMPRADWSLLKDYLITFPSVKEQAAISDILSTNDKEINLLEQKLDQLQKQKKALMQLLLTGIVRVTIYPAKGGEKNGKEYTPCCSEF